LTIREKGPKQIKIAKKKTLPQVIGAAIAINILIPQIPLVGGCVLSAADTLVILLFYRPDGSLRALRAFELFVTAFVLGVFISFCIELSYVSQPVGDVFDGFLPSREIFVSDGLYQSCAILGGTLMPHTLYLGSGLVQARMRDFDRKNEKYHEARASESEYSIMLYRPSLSAIKSCMAYSIAELCITLFIVAVFVNSAILIVAASSLSQDAGDADLFGIYDIFVSSISQASGTIFALGLLFSGVSAGIVATMAGQLVCEGAMNWRMSPFFRRLVTRSIAIVPGVVIAAAEGRDGLAAALNGCNVVLSVALIFLTFPLVWYTSIKKYMRVQIEDGDEAVGVVDGILTRDTERATREAGQGARGTVSLANNWATTIGAWIIWFIIAVMNVATLVFLGTGMADD
jgi:metal iron transporter